ncbi:hypothetical protein B0J11DRAFT_606696 [Dendryphion nanum]|uniref:Uncharacterized protein n=1 Tax=Dendryphion nanum TaxID=256645 RepID=A0A9P9DR20_9PLEO|nr:hypothetical protein B0J11DRAFT_606696 [Dendryphion nanum]
MAKGSTEAPTGKVFSDDVIAALLMSLSVTSITGKQYELMSAMDGTKTASAFQHDFRSVLQKVKELKTRTDAGETFEAVKTGAKRVHSAMKGPSTPPATPKRVKKEAKTPAKPAKPRAKKAKLDLSPRSEAAEPECDGAQGSRESVDASSSNGLDGVKSEHGVDDVWF